MEKEICYGDEMRKIIAVTSPIDLRYNLNRLAFTKSPEGPYDMTVTNGHALVQKKKVFTADMGNGKDVILFQIDPLRRIQKNDRVVFVQDDNDHSKVWLTIVTKASGEFRIDPDEDESYPNVYQSIPATKTEVIFNIDANLLAIVANAVHGGGKVTVRKSSDDSCPYFVEGDYDMIGVMMPIVFEKSEIPAGTDAEVKNNE